MGVDEVHRWATQKTGHELIRRPIVDIRRRLVLEKPASIDHGNAIGERHRFGLVVGDVERQDIEFLLQMFQLESRFHPQLRVEIRKRLVHEKSFRSPHHRAGQSDSLPLAAR